MNDLKGEINAPERLIDANELMEWLRSKIRECVVLNAHSEAATAEEIMRYVKCMPAVDVAPVVHGRWAKMMGMMPPEYHGHYECSECQWHMKGLRNSWTREEELTHCPNCGARMDADQCIAFADQSGAECADNPTV